MAKVTGSKKLPKKKTLGEKQYDTYVSELDSNFDKMGRVQKMYKGASPKIKADLKNKFKKLSDSFGSSEMISSARRETGRTEKAKGGRAGYQGGGRTNLLEELGRVEGESSNRNRRAEVSRIHGELNRGYKKGGRAGYKHGGAAKRGRGCEIKS